MRTPPSLREPMSAAQAGSRLRFYISEVRRFDEINADLNDKRRELFRAVKDDGFSAKTVKSVARTPSTDAVAKEADDLRQYLAILCGPEAAKLLRMIANSALCYSGPMIPGHANTRTALAIHLNEHQITI